jgi:hypothetical protein
VDRLRNAPSAAGNQASLIRVVPVVPRERDGIKEPSAGPPAGSGNHYNPTATEGVQVPWTSEKLVTPVAYFVTPRSAFRRFPIWGAGWGSSRRSSPANAVRCSMPWTPPPPSIIGLSHNSCSAVVKCALSPCDKLSPGRAVARGVSAGDRGRGRRPTQRCGPRGRSRGQWRTHQCRR